MHYKILCSQKSSFFTLKVAWSGQTDRGRLYSVPWETRKSVCESGYRKKPSCLPKYQRSTYCSAKYFLFFLHRTYVDRARKQSVTCSFCLNKSTTFFRAALHDPWSGDPRTITVSANHASAPAALEVSLVRKSLPSLHSVGERGSRT